MYEIRVTLILMAAYSGSLALASVILINDHRNIILSYTVHSTHLSILQASTLSIGVIVLKNLLVLITVVRRARYCYINVILLYFIHTPNIDLGLCNNCYQ